MKLVFVRVTVVLARGHVGHFRCERKWVCPVIRAVVVPPPGSSSSHFDFFLVDSMRSTAHRDIWLPLALVAALSCCPASECAGLPSRAVAGRGRGAGDAP